MTEESCLLATCLIYKTTREFSGLALSNAAFEILLPFHSLEKIVGCGCGWILMYGGTNV